MPQSSVWKLETQECQWYSSKIGEPENKWYRSVWIWRPENQECQGQERLMSQFKQSGTVNSTFFHFFVPVRPWTNWRMPPYSGERHLLFSVHQSPILMLISSEILSQKRPEILFNQRAGHPTIQKLTHKINYHTQGGMGKNLLTWRYVSSNFPN